MDKMTFKELKNKLDEIVEDERWKNERVEAARKLLSEQGIEISFLGENPLMGRCYTANRFSVISSVELPHDLLLCMSKNGIIGWGQETRFNNIEREDGLFEIRVLNRCDSSD